MNSDSFPIHPTPSEVSGSRRQLLTGAAAFAAATMFPQGGQAASEPGSKANPFSLDGKVAIVTGAARGIGRSIAIALASAGADVLGIDVAGPASPDVTYAPASEVDLKETGKMIAGTGRRFIPVVADIRNFAELEAAVARAEKELGPVDILVADAGIQIFTPLAESTQRQWQDVIDVNLTGTANTIRAIAPYMIKRKKGSIIAIASGQGRHGMKNGAAYSASKWGIIGLVKSVALELGEYHIRVNTIEPGLVDTVMTRNKDRWNEALKLAGKEPQDSPKEEDVVKAQLLHATMKIPWLQAEDIAPAAVFLASDASRWVSGATYDVTGGDSANYTA